MAKIDLSKFIDNNLKAEFDAKPYDVSKDRAKLIKRFEAALNQQQSGNSKVPNKLWKSKNGVVEFSVPSLTVNGTTTNYIPEGQFGGFITALIELTGEGEFDKYLTISDVAKGVAPKGSAGTRPPKTFEQKLKSTVAAAKRFKWTPEQTKTALKDKGASDEQIKAALA